MVASTVSSAFDMKSSEYVLLYIHIGSLKPMLVVVYATRPARCAYLIAQLHIKANPLPGGIPNAGV
jgi:hypothetical protein